MKNRKTAVASKVGGRELGLSWLFDRFTFVDCVGVFYQYNFLRRNALDALF
jgi:hypothetical protein